MTDERREERHSGDLLICHIGELVCVPQGPIRGRAMSAIPRIHNAALLVRDGRIAWFGAESALPAHDPATQLDARGGCVVPGLVDCHTHTIFTGSRENEFVERIVGATYAEIAERGGGIRTTVAAVRRADSSELIAGGRERLGRMLHHGVTTVEIKSGYGLSVLDELRMLEAIDALRGLQPIELAATYLAAHTVPIEFAGRAEPYLDLMFSDEVLGTIRDRHLAEFCDVFCERTAFTAAQARRCLTMARQFGLRAKIHADQITQVGASRLAGELGAISADHLEEIDDEGIAALRTAGTVAVLLPACSWFLGVPQAPARRLIEAGLPVALGTDYNPGSSMVESLPLTMSIACTQMRITPDEAISAATANAAAALGRQDRIGAIRTGMQADLVLLDVPNLNRWMYEPGRNCLRCVIKAGRVVHSVDGCGP